MFNVKRAGYHSPHCCRTPAYGEWHLQPERDSRVAGEKTSSMKRETLSIELVQQIAECPTRILTVAGPVAVQQVHEAGGIAAGHGEVRGLGGRGC